MTRYGRREDDEHAALLLRVNEAAALLGIGTTTLREMIARGEIASVRIGRRRLVPRRAVEEFVNSWTD
jgi:excisionase family DNA binding protein